MTRQVLVTGATGFVGRRLCTILLKRGDRVRAAVRSSAAALRLPPGVEPCLIGEIGPDTDWNNACTTDVDVVFHLAARVHQLRDRAADPAAEFQRVNTAGSACLAEAAVRHGVRRFVYVSSVHAMCTLADDVLTEQSACAPSTAYGRSKLAAERVLQEVTGRTATELVVVRPPPVYGPGHLGNLSKLLKLAERGWPLPLGGIDNRRSLVFVDNLVDALIAVAEHSAAAGETFLVSDGDSVSLPELVSSAARAGGRSPRLLPAPTSLMKTIGRLTGKSDAVARLLGSLAVDDGKLRRTLAWRPPVTLSEGLQSTMRWVRDAA